MNVYDVVDRLPSIEVLRDRCRALAVLELIQGSGYAYYTYGEWGDDEAALMSNGTRTVARPAQRSPTAVPTVRERTRVLR